jgi:putative oxygen-independent coproporphyrinogen III oxidase
MSGIYIHIPFCKKRCNYCDFYSTINYDIKDEYLKALTKEIEIQTEYLENKTVETIYFGGGTPSVLEPDDIRDIIIIIKDHFDVSKNSENTLEINPDDNRNEYFEKIRAIGINRISIGVQSFDPIVLKLLGRRHSEKQIYKCIEDAIHAGIENIGIDLIYGLPGMTSHSWELTLEKAFELPIRHLSAYHLSYEKGTVFYKKLLDSEFAVTKEEESWKQFKIIHKMAVDNNFEHYEISNFSKKGFYSKHNSNYWNGTTYLGLGPSAHSYNGLSRQWNYSNLNKYVQFLKSHKLPGEIEILTEVDKINDYLLTRLRTNRGINFDEFHKKFGVFYNKTISDEFEKYLISGHARRIKNSGSLTLKGWYISDKIISDLMIER